MNNNVLKEIRDGRKSEQIANATEYNENIRESWLEFWVRNTADNHPSIKQMFKEGSKDISVMGHEANKHCLIIGSGPSLNDWEPYLKDWTGDIMISSSHLAFFEAIGVKPTYCFIIDADPMMSHLVGDADTKDIRLITHPQMDPEILRQWQGEVFFFRMQDPGDEFFSKYVPYMYNDFMDHETKEKWPGIRSHVLNSGNVTNTMLALCGYMGYKNMFLCGVDLGFPGGQYRFTGYRRTEDGYRVEGRMGIPEDRATRVAANGVLTDQVSCFYKYSTLILWGMDAPELYSCSRGILTEMPHVSPEYVVACQGDVADKYKLTAKEKYAIAQEYLRYRGIYIQKRPGKTFKLKPKDFRDSKKSIVKYMLFTNWIRGKLTPEVRKQVIMGILPSPAVRFRILWFELQVTEEERNLTFLGYTGITNSSHVKGWQRAKVKLKFNIGRMVHLW